jgi:peptidoglycan/xylan/chitin deacetylase (PgdA/CDA1 family)
MNSKNYTHAIMFHHFHGLGHPQVQGSISGAEFEEMLDWLSSRFTLLSAPVYLEKLEKESLHPTDICLSFDDALLCQADVAVTVLNKRNIQAFFFVYSSPFVGNPDPLEIYRYFRTVEFSDMDQFYNEFFKEAEGLYFESIFTAKQSYDSMSYLSAFPFYSESDKWFRYLRDQVLDKEKYDFVMNRLMDRYKFNQKEASAKLWMNDDHIRRLSDTGHIVGLHSYSHPTMIHKLSKERQSEEYVANFEHLSSVLRHNPIAMSHPCGNYGDETLDILKKLGIKVGFRRDNSVTSIISNLEVPREDHANILRQMKQ